MVAMHTILDRETAEAECLAHCTHNKINNLRRLNNGPKFDSSSSTICGHLYFT